MLNLNNTTNINTPILDITTSTQTHVPPSFEEQMEGAAAAAYAALMPCPHRASTIQPIQRRQWMFNATKVSFRKPTDPEEEYVECPTAHTKTLPMRRTPSDGYQTLTFTATELHQAFAAVIRRNNKWNLAMYDLPSKMLVALASISILDNTFMDMERAVSEEIERLSRIHRIDAIYGGSLSALAVTDPHGVTRLPLYDDVSHIIHSGVARDFRTTIKRWHRQGIYRQGVGACADVRSLIALAFMVSMHKRGVPMYDGSLPAYTDSAMYPRPLSIRVKNDAAQLLANILDKPTLLRAGMHIDTLNDSRYRGEDRRSLWYLIRQLLRMSGYFVEDVPEYGMLAVVNA